jgi:hypothetical protein
MCRSKEVEVANQQTCRLNNEKEATQKSSRGPAKLETVAQIFY